MGVTKNEKAAGGGKKGASQPYKMFTHSKTSQQNRSEQRNELDHQQVLEGLGSAAPSTLSSGLAGKKVHV